MYILHPIRGYTRACRLLVRSKLTGLVYPDVDKGQDNELLPEPAKYRKYTPPGDMVKQPPLSTSEDRSEDGNYQSDQIKINAKQHVSHMIDKI